jgi:hypothetical protein
MIEGSSTAIARKDLTAPFQWLLENNLLTKTPGLDFGCGKSMDAEEYGWDRYDPAHHPVYPTGKYRVITCTYVLNVIHPKTQLEVLRQIQELLHKTQGVAYISVRRDVTVDRPGRGCIQRVVKFRSQPIFEKAGGFAIYEATHKTVGEMIHELRRRVRNTRTHSG